MTFDLKSFYERRKLFDNEYQIYDYSTEFCKTCNISFKNVDNYYLMCSSCHDLCEKCFFNMFETVEINTCGYNKLCINCNESCAENNTIISINNLFEICKICYETCYDDVKNKIKTTLFQSGTHLHDKLIVNDDKLIVANRYNNEELDINDEIKQHVNNETDEHFLNMISYVKETNIIDLLQWTLLGQMVTCPGIESDFGLMVKCEYPYPVASICNGRYGSRINILYNNYTEYLQDLEIWTEKRASINFDENDDECDDKYMVYCESFAQYVRCTKKMTIVF